MLHLCGADDRSRHHVSSCRPALSQLTIVKPGCSCSSAYERVLCARGALNPVVAPCEDMLPYIPILIHHLWNVRKCVVSRGLKQRPHWEKKKKKKTCFRSRNNKCKQMPFSSNTERKAKFTAGKKKKSVGGRRRCAAVG